MQPSLSLDKVICWRVNVIVVMLWWVENGAVEQEGDEYKFS
jgi:hypothetical protein